MKEPVYFLKLEFENVRCFGNKAILDLSDGKGNWKRWTVILGDNGMGKTTLLQSLASVQQYSNKTIHIYRREAHGDVFILAHFVDILFDFKVKKGLLKASLISSKTNPNDKFFVEYKVNLEENFWNTNYDSNLNGNYFILFGYSANRNLGYSSLISLSKDVSDSLFTDDAKLINAEEWLLQLDYAASKESEIKKFAINKRNQVKQILIDLLPDVEEIRFTTPTKENFKSSVEFKTPFSWVTIHQLSLGYKTMVAWMVDLAARMFERYPDSQNPLAEPAIVLVDEIDLHLHPKWQRKIFDYLSEKFPATQFIVTAHSPLIVQSAPKEANIVVLRREGDHVIIDNDIESVQNWRLDQIMSSDLFGVESARGPETEKWLNERKQLLQKERLTQDEKAKLNELNRKAHNLPTADTAEDIEAMEVIRKAADYLKSQKA